MGAGMEAWQAEWAGVRFWSLFMGDAHFHRRPGVYAFVQRIGHHRTILFVDHADNIATALDGHHDRWVDAQRLGFNELNLNLEAVERTDRLLLRGHIIKRCSPILNVIDQQCNQEEWSRKAG